MYLHIEPSCSLAAVLFMKTSYRCCAGDTFSKVNLTVNLAYSPASLTFVLSLSLSNWSRVYLIFSRSSAWPVRSAAQCSRPTAIYMGSLRR